MNLDHLPLLDHHAHPLYREAGWRAAPLEAYFTEAYDSAQLALHSRSGIFFLRSVRELAAFYGCAPSPEALQEARAAADYAKVTDRLLRAAGIGEVLLDDGFLQGVLMTVRESAKLPWKVRRILRLEGELAALVPFHDDAKSLLGAFERHLREVAPTLAGFKSIIAYRTGLDVRRREPGEVERAYTDLKRGLAEGEVPKLSSKPLLDAALWTALGVARDAGLPVQFHTGYGDPDLDLRLASPLHLRAIFEDEDLRGLNVVMLHCYPFTREAGYLASVYPGAHLDLGLTIPFASLNAMRTHVREALHLAPLSKILFSTDASRTPELFYLGARWGRRVIGEVLSDTAADGDLTGEQAEWAAERLLRGNAQDLYGSGLPGTGSVRTELQALHSLGGNL